MKIELESERKFKPIVITITIESLEELEKFNDGMEESTGMECYELYQILYNELLKHKEN